MNFKQTMKAIGRHIWEFFKGSIPATIMYFCAGSVLLMLTMKENALTWDNGKLAWTIVCILAAVGYNILVTYAQGGNAYEMLVSGNMKRVSQEQFEGGYKISSHKYAKEYRVWKGFGIGAFVAIWPIIAGILFGANQTAIDTKSVSTGLGIMQIVCLLLSGWSLLPFYYYNLGGKEYYVGYTSGPRQFNRTCSAHFNKTEWQKKVAEILASMETTAVETEPALTPADNRRYFTNIFTLPRN